MKLSLDFQMFEIILFSEVYLCFGQFYDFSMTRLVFELSKKRKSDLSRVAKQLFADTFSRISQAVYLRIQVILFINLDYKRVHLFLLKLQNYNTSWLTIHRRHTLFFLLSSALRLRHWIILSNKLIMHYKIKQKYKNAET